MNFISKTLKSRLARNSLWLIVLQVFNLVVPMLTLPYITRILSTSAYGEFSLALNWITYIQIIVEYGFGLTGAKKVAMNKDRDELSRTHSSILFARLFLMSACFVILCIVICIADFEKTLLISLIILFLMVVSTAFQQTWLFQGMSEMQNITIINVVSRTISVLLIFLFVKSPDDLYLYCFLYVSNYLIASIAGCFIVYKKYGVKIKFSGIKFVFFELKESFAVFLSSAMGKIFSGIGVTVLGFFATRGLIGVYSAINKITYVLIILFSALSQALYPHSCKSFGSSFDDGIRSVKKYAFPILLFFCFCGILIIVFNKIIVDLVFGSAYTRYSSLLIPFALYSLQGILNNFLGIQILVASGHSNEYSKAFSISTVFMFVFLLVLGKLWNVYGVAYASMFSEIILTFLLLYYISKIKNARG